MPRQVPLQLKLKRSRGQHLLCDANMLKKIVASAALKEDDCVVEIGAGTGNLTVLLAQKVRRVIAIEIDNDLTPILRERCADHPNVEIIHADARLFSPASCNLSSAGYLVVANIPYNITSFLLRKFLSEHPRPSCMILLIQKEVAERICAQPPHMNLLALAVRYAGTAKILFSVPRDCFVPKPNVQSAVIRIVLDKKTDEQEGREEKFFKLIHAGFSAKRKLLASNLSHGLNIPRDEIEKAFAVISLSRVARAQELSLDQWLSLVDSL